MAHPCLVRQLHAQYVEAAQPKSAAPPASKSRLPRLAALFSCWELEPRSVKGFSGQEGFVSNQDKVRYAALREATPFWVDRQRI